MIVPFKDAKWDSVACLNYVLEQVDKDTPVICIWLDKENLSNSSAANLDTFQLNWILDSVKLQTLLGE